MVRKQAKVRVAAMAWWWIPGFVTLALVAAVVLLGAVVWGGEDGGPLAPLYEEIVPAEGTETVYGLPLAWENAAVLLAWNDEVYEALSPEEMSVVSEALNPLAAPCCDDYDLPGCCCEGADLLCNLVRTARGLAAHMTVEGRFTVEETREAVLEWLRFAHGDYYVAAELRRRGVDPTPYGITTRGACYRGKCETPLVEGGCGGMRELKIRSDGV